jgi:hypothetical protein
VVSVLGSQPKGPWIETTLRYWLPGWPMMSPNNDLVSKQLQDDAWFCVHMHDVRTVHGAHGVVVSHPLRMRKALGSNPSVSI